jgi:hypothetical protein
MKPHIRQAKTLPTYALLGLFVLVHACGGRTSMNRPRADAGPDVPRTVMPRDGAVADLPDLRPDLGPDLEPPVLPEVSPDRPPDIARDLPTERFPDVVMPGDRGPDRFGDLPPDLGRELPIDRMPDVVIPIDRFPDVVIPIDRGPDRFGDLPPLLDGPCAEGATVPCTCANGMAGTHICLPSHGWSECGCGTPELMRVRNGLIGTWTGTVTTPWVSPYAVTFTFDSYSHYSAKSADGLYPALYYGTDDDSPDKRYDVSDIEDNGDASGFIDLVWSAGGSGDATREMLQGIQLSADGSKLTFWFLHFGTYGPIKYDLQRSTP